MEEYDHLFKIIIVGDAFVGKSSLMNRFVNDLFGEEYNRTLGVEFGIAYRKMFGLL